MIEAFVPPYKPLLNLAELSENVEDIERGYPDTGANNIAPGSMQYIEAVNWNNRYMDAHASMLEAVSDILNQNLNSPKRAVDALREFVSERWNVQWEYEERFAPRINFDSAEL